MSITFSDALAVAAEDHHDYKDRGVTDAGVPARPSVPPVVEFPAGLPGFPMARRFALEELGEHLRPFRRLRSLGEPEAAFTVVEPGLLFPGYTLEIDDDHQASLGVSSADQIMTLVMITVPGPPQPPTANLLGPIVINKETGVAAQVVQHRSSYKVAEPLPGS